MKIFGYEITKSNIVGQPVPARPWCGSWFGPILECNTGAWQRDMVCESTPNVLAFSAVYACISIIAEDISKLRIKLIESNKDGIWQEVTAGSPFLPVLRKPNRYQTRIQFLSQWVTSLLLHGNAYIYKERDGRGMVVALYVLDPRRCRPMTTPDGDTYYSLGHDYLAGITGPSTTTPNGENYAVVHADEIIHDRLMTPWHPLCGVSPIFACGVAATQGLRIQTNSEMFFRNMSRPSGQLTAPGLISDETALRLKQQFEHNFSGGNLGRLMIGGEGLKYEPMTIPAQDAQLIEQLKWTVEDVARCFRVPPYKIGASANPTFSNISSLNQDYYTQTLQARVENIELLLDEGFGLKADYGIEMDLEILLRMDPAARATAYEIGIRSGYLKPNEARFGENRGPVTGGDTPYMQQQNYALSALAKRDQMANPFATSNPATPPGTTPDPKPPADPAADPADDGAEQLGILLTTVQKGFADVQRV